MVRLLRVDDDKALLRVVDVVVTGAVKAPTWTTAHKATRNAVMVVVDRNMTVVVVVVYVD